MKKLYFFICTLLLVGSTNGQDSNSVFQITNQLGFSLSANTVSKGKLLGNINYSYAELSTPTYGGTYTQWSNGSTLNLGFGLAKNWELSLQTGHRFIRTRYDDWFPSSYNYSRWNGIALATKVNLFHQKKWRPELAISAEGVFDSDLYFEEMDIRFAWSYLLGDKFRLGGNFAFFDNYGTVDLDNFIDNFYYTLNARYSVGNGFGVFGEIDMPKSLDTYVSNVSVGAFYSIKTNMMVHLKYNQFLTFNSYSNPPKASFIAGGFSWLLGKN